MNLLVGGTSVLVTGLLLATGAPAVADRFDGVTTRVSVADDGSQATETKRKASDVGISADGRYVVFVSQAPLVPGDTNGFKDVFVRDRTAKTTRMVSVAMDGGPGASPASEPSISADGRYVAFRSGSADLVPGDTNGQPDVFVRDLQTGTTERVSVYDDGSQSEGNAFSADISGDGRFVLFLDGANLDPSGPQEPGGGLYVRDRVTGTTSWVADAESGEISEHGRFVAFSQLSRIDGDFEYDVYVLDRQTGTTELASSSGFEVADLSMSDNGRFVAYTALLDPRADLRRVLVRDMRRDTTTYVSVSNRHAPGIGDPVEPVLSGSGHFVAYRWSEASKRDPSASRRVLVYGYDFRSTVTEPISVSSSGERANQPARQSWRHSIAVSSTGRFVAFVSRASNLVPHDTNRAPDVFVRDRRPH